MPARPSRPPAAALLLAAASAACGGSGTGTGPDPSTGMHTVVVTVFYDENRNGALDAGEAGRVPGVSVDVAGRSAVSEKLTGRVTVAGVPAGVHAVSARAASLPAYYAPAGGGGLTLTAPQAAGAETRLPLTLPIGSNSPATYMAVGDSITAGDGSVQHAGYRSVLQGLLRSHFGAGTVVDESQSGAKSDTGAERLGASLARVRPAYTLILYGTNDWQRIECREAPPCFTVEALRSMVRAARDAQSLPVLGTIPPVNPETAQEGRNEWVDRMNEFVRPMARQEGAALADVNAALKRAGDLRQFFVDRVHPNDRGYEVIAEEFLAAITRPLAAAASALHLPAQLSFGPRPPQPPVRQLGGLGRRAAIHSRRA